MTKPSSRRHALPFSPELSWEERLARTKECANKAGCRRYAVDRLGKLGLLVSFGDGSRWEFTRDGRAVASWTPENGYLRFYGDRDTTKCYDVFQVVHEMESGCDRRRIG